MQWFHFDPGDFCISFLSILFEGMPFMFFGTLLAGVVDSFLPEQALKNMLPRNQVLAILVSGFLGIIFPMCECGVIPVIRRMILKGLPVPCSVTYLLAAPIVNPVVALGTFAAFRGQDPWWIASSRLGLGYGIAALAGLIFAKLPAEKIFNRSMLHSLKNSRLSQRGFLQHPVSSLLRLETEKIKPRRGGSIFAEVKAKSFLQKVAGAMRCAGFDFLDVGFYLILGAALTALFNTAVRQQVIEGFASNAPLATGAMMFLAGLLSLCSTSDAFIAANFIAFPAAAKMAFMVFGPMMDLKLILMYGMIFRRHVALMMAVGLFLVVGFACLLWGGIPR